MKVLHVGNVAQNAYRNAKILNAAGIDSYVAHYDFFHFACCPEWDELAAANHSLSDFGDPYFPNFLTVPNGETACPEWAAIGPQYQVTAYLDLLVSGHPNAELGQAALLYSRLKAAHYKTTSPQGKLLSEPELLQMMRGLNISDRLHNRLLDVRLADDMLGYLRTALLDHYDASVADNFAPPIAPDYADGLLANYPQQLALFREKRASGFTYATGLELDPQKLPAFNPPSAARPEDAQVFSGAVPWWRHLFEKFDAVVLYGQTPLLGYLANWPFIGYEHGSIRNLPFDDSVTSRLLKLAYESSARTFITNMDYLSAEERIDLTPEQRIYMPHAFDEKKSQDFVANNPVVREAGRTVKFFGVARQVWQDLNDVDLAKCNDRIIRAARLLRDEGVDNFEVLFVDWGVDAQASKDLIDALDVGQHFNWTEPAPLSVLWRRYLEADAIFDQFHAPAIGGISIEAMALGRRVITYSREDVDMEFWGERLPVLAAHSVEDIAEQMKAVIADPDDAAGIGASATDFILRKHSSARIVELFNEALPAVS